MAKNLAEGNSEMTASTEVVERSLSLAGRLLDIGENDKAAKLCQDVLRLQPKNGQVLKTLGMIHLKQHHYKEAVICLSLASMIIPDSPEILNNLGSAFLCGKKYSHARDAVNSALALDSQSFNAHYLLGLLNYCEGDLDAALGSFNRALELSPGSDQAVFQRGVTFLALERWSDAERDFRSVLETGNNCHECIPRLIDAISEQGRPEEAVAIARLEHRKRPGSRDIASALIDSLIAVRADQEALDHYMRLNPSVQEDRLEIADIISVKEWRRRQKGQRGIYKTITPPRVEYTSEPRVIGVSPMKFDEETFLLPEEYRAELQDVRVFSRSFFILTGDGAVLHDRLALPHSNKHCNRVEPLTRASAKGRVLLDLNGLAEEKADKGIMMFGLYSKEYGHWLGEHIGRWASIDGCSEFDDYPVYADDGMPKTHYEILRRLVGPEREIKIIPGNTVVHFEKLVVLSLPILVPTLLKPWSYDDVSNAYTNIHNIRYLRRAFEPLIRQVRNGKKRRIYLSRALCGPRALVNENEISTFLEGCGFEILHPQKMTFVEQVEAFANAEFIVGPCGSAFNNSIFCSEGARIFMLIGEAIRIHVSWATCMKQINMDCVFIYGVTTTGFNKFSTHADYKIPLSLIKEALIDCL